MTHPWHDRTPIYRQLKEKIVSMLLDGVLQPGAAVPSVRQISADYQLNPLTVSKALQELADEGLIEKRRGLGMFVVDGASESLLDAERANFYGTEWPLVVKRAQQLGIDLRQLINKTAREGNR